MERKNPICGVICELNPPHNGHAALFARARETGADAVVAVMSGNFVERGEAAVLDKWSRARFALEMGADLVIELPVPWAVAGAERFARGGVSILQSLGLPGALVFGSECGDMHALENVAACLCTPAFSENLRPGLSAGLSFAAARENAVREMLGEPAAAILREPNNILGVEYLRAIRELDAPFTAETLRRLGPAHDAPAPSGGFASASYLRETGDLAGYVPEPVLTKIEALRREGKYPASLSYLTRAVLAQLLSAGPEGLRNVPDVSEGLEHRILEAARRAETLPALYDAAKTKRYSHARIRRIVLAAFLGLTNDLPALPPYVHLLGMTEKGAALLKQAEPAVPVVARSADAKALAGDASRVFSLEARADDLYALCTETRRPAGMTYIEKLIRLQH